MNETNQYVGLYQDYRWLVPARFNIGDACCTRWAANSADARRIALYLEDSQGRREVWTFERLHATATRLAHALVRMGVKRGDRVAVSMGQRGELLATFFALWQLGAAAVPLSPRLSPPLLERCLRDCGARLAIIDDQAQAGIMTVQHRCPALRQILGLDLADERVIPWRGLLARQPQHDLPANRSSHDDEPIALVFYLTETQTHPRAIAHAHAALIGALPGFVASHDWFPQHADAYWTALDWCSCAGLLQAVLPCLYFGRPLIGTLAMPAASDILQLLQRYRVTHLQAAPHVLHQLRRAAPDLQPADLPALRCVVSTGQYLSESLHEWYQRHWDITINNLYGLAEAPALVGDSQARWPRIPGSLGKIMPGHQIAVLDAAGLPLTGQRIGEIVVGYTDIHGDPDPALWLGDLPELSRTPGAWLPTGDRGYRDTCGTLWLIGPQAELLQTGHELLDPQRLEDSLRWHPGVADVAVLAYDDASAAARLKVYVAPQDLDLVQNPAVLNDLQHYIQRHWPASAWQLPVQFEWRETLPRWPSGALQRLTLRTEERQRRRRRRSRTAAA